MAKKSSGFSTATPDKAGTSFDKTSASPRVTYKTSAGKKGSGCAARKDIQKKDENY